MDNRAVSPVVGKLLAAGIAVLYVASMTGVLLGGAVPDYRAATGSELGERVLATAASDVEQSVPATESNATVRHIRSLPRTIAGDRYRLTISNRTLRLDHPDDRIDTEARLSLPTEVTVNGGTWESGDQLAIHVHGEASDRRLSIREAAS
jgi:hypothetical protein